MTWMVGVLLGLGAVCIAATFLPIWKTTQWWVRVCDLPASRSLSLLCLLLRSLRSFAFLGNLADWLILGFLVGVVIWQLTWVGPYLPGAPRAVQSCSGTVKAANERITLLTANVLLTNRDANRFL